MSDMDTAEAAERLWSSASLADLTEHIVARHHAFLREELPAIDAMIAQFTPSEATQHAQRIPPLRASFRHFRAELEGHLQKEEVILGYLLQVGVMGMEEFFPGSLEPDEEISLKDFDDPADPPSGPDRMGYEISLGEHGGHHGTKPSHKIVTF